MEEETLKRKDVANIAIGRCSPRRNRKGVKYISLTKFAAYGTSVNCKTDCPFYPCQPKPYLVVPVTNELKVALKMFFPKMKKGENYYERQAKIKQFVREWARRK